MPKLHEKNCASCNGEITKFNDTEIQNHLKEINNWQFKDDFIFKEFKFKNFSNTLDFVNEIGALSEAQNHHPNIEFTWGYLKISIQTHTINGVCENDFILAARIDQLKKV